MSAVFHYDVQIPSRFEHIINLQHILMTHLLIDIPKHINLLIDGHVLVLVEVQQRDHLYSNFIVLQICAFVDLPKGSLS